MDKHHATVTYLQARNKDCVAVGDCVAVYTSGNYRKMSNTRRTKHQNLNVFHLGLQLSLHNILKPSFKWRMKM